MANRQNGQAKKPDQSDISPTNSGEDANSSEFAQRLMKAMTLAGLNRNRVAIAIGIDGKQVDRWVRGDTEPKVTQLVALADLFEVSLEWLVRGVERTNSEDGLDADERFVVQAFREEREATRLTATQAVKRLTSPQVGPPL